MKKNIIILLFISFNLNLFSNENKLLNDNSVTLEELKVISIVESNNPLKIIANPKNPIQPIPASDGADFLKNIPGFSTKRKGGIDSDPIFRGMSGSKLGIFSDGQELYGGCGGRMDPPTAYIFPESYDRVVVIKGPQTVLVGSGFSAGVVSFEKKPRYYQEPVYNVYSSFKQGSFGRNDQFIDISAGDTFGYAKIIATRSSSHSYKDGNDNIVDSNYSRWNTSATLGYTPNQTTIFELTGVIGDGKARYSDRSMDASKLYRSNISFKAIKYDLFRNIDKLEFLVYRNYVDHIMDNYTLRNSASFSAMNPDRTVIGGNLKISTQAPSLFLFNESGLDFKNDTHTTRMVMNQTNSSMANKNLYSLSRNTDYKFSQIGFFDELTFDLNNDNKFITGFRLDLHKSVDKRQTSIYYNEETSSILPSGFIRYENNIESIGLNSYIGFGHSQRYPDYWERTKKEVNIKDSEKTNQLDIGTSYTSKNITTNVSLFYSKVNDYILNRWFNEFGQSIPSKSYNINATIYGGELSLTYKISPEYKIIGLLTHVIGKNETENKPLAQQPPLEAKISAVFDNGKYSASFLARFIAQQDRYDVGSGSIVSNGADKGKTSGASIYSINAGYKFNKYLWLSCGVDNILNKAYAEHLSNSNMASASDFLNQTKIYEIGRNIWFELKTIF